MAAGKRLRAVRQVQEAVVAVIKDKSTVKGDSALKSLTTAAMVLPGMLNMAAASDNEVTLQYGHYEEADRDIYGIVPAQSTPLFNLGRLDKGRLPNNYHPITVDSIHLKSKLSFWDRFRFFANYTEDTWSGATPIATAPAGFGGNNAYVIQSNGDHNTPVYGDVLSGASPLLQTPAGGAQFDANLKPLRFKGFNDSFQQEYVADSQLTHTMTMASPETRKQGDFKLSYEGDEFAIDLGGGISVENDYESRFVNWGGQLFFNQKLTTVDFSQSYTNSTTKALLDHDSLPYLSVVGYLDQIDTAIVNGYAASTLIGEREDWSTHLSLAQVLGKTTLMEVGVDYTYSSGFMENPYKAVYVFFIDPGQVPAVPGVFNATTRAYIEQRPDVRNQWNFNLRLVQHIAPFDAAVNVSYSFFHDDWGINAHTFEGSWVQPLPGSWRVTPTIRYYSQSAAGFYTPYLVTKNQASGNKDSLQNYRQIPQKYFSSDHRLSGYGALSGGVVVNKDFAKGISLQMGFEYYAHKGALKIGGGGEGSYADFSAWSANAALKIDLETMGSSLAYSNHSNHQHQHDSLLPAGVMGAHMLTKAGDWMFGYRYAYNRQDGVLLKGTNKISDGVVLASTDNCGGKQCYVAPDKMIMHMHMFNIMYAPTDWLNLMIMPTYVDMSMAMRPLDGAPPASTTNQPEVIHSAHEHMTGGIGDTLMMALFKLFDNRQHHLHLGLGISAPSGDVEIVLRDTHRKELGLIHYGMQLGSGTWDFAPNLTYTGQVDNWSWGAQLSLIKRLEGENEVGYRLGDVFSSTAWAIYQFYNWLSFSVRGIYTSQGALRGEYNEFHRPIGPMDSQSSYGGQFWDLGVGLNAVIPSGDLAGNGLSVEWIEPVKDDVNGIQLERDGTLSINWHYMF